MNAIHRPLNPAPPKKRRIPSMMKPYAMTWPVAAAMRVALAALPVIHQMTARSTRPPSIGKPGTILKIASPILM